MNYTIRSPLQNKLWFYAKQWIVYGYNENERNDKSKWIKIHEGVSSEGVYCGSGTYCTTGVTFTFQFYELPEDTSFKYIRFVNIQQSTNKLYFIIKYFE